MSKVRHKTSINSDIHHSPESLALPDLILTGPPRCTTAIDTQFWISLLPPQNIYTQLLPHTPTWSVFQE